MLKAVKSKKILAVAIAFIANGAQADSLAVQIAGMQNSSWIQANRNTLSSVATPEQHGVVLYDGSSGTYNNTGSYSTNVNAIIDAWSSFAWDSKRGDLIVYGGGHANYAGNEVYTWHSTTQLWERSSLPTALNLTATNPANNAKTFVTVDNGATPQSAHTYDNNLYLPIADRFLTFGGYSFNYGTPYLKYDVNGNLVKTGPYLFDPNRADGNKLGGTTGTGTVTGTEGGNMWQNRDIYANAGASSSISFSAGKTDVIQRDGKDVVYVVGSTPNEYGQSLYEYTINDVADPSQDTWRVVGTPHSSTWFGQGAGAYSAELNIFVTTGINDLNLDGKHIALPFLFWDLNHAGTNNAQQSFTVTDTTNGLFSFSSLANMGLEYNPDDGDFYLWGGGQNVFRLSHTDGLGLSEGWVLALDGIISSNGAPGAAPGTGVLGKWKYATDLNAFVGLTAGGNVFFYKTANSAVPLPAAVWLFGTTLAGLGWLQRKRTA